jgi:hypothetical protein
MRWPVDIGWEDFLASIQGAIFEHAAKGLEPWVDVIKMMPDRFDIPTSCAFRPQRKKYFPQTNLCFILFRFHSWWTLFLHAACVLQDMPRRAITLVISIAIFVHHIVINQSVYSLKDDFTQQKQKRNAKATSWAYYILGLG